LFEDIFPNVRFPLDAGCFEIEVTLLLCGGVTFEAVGTQEGVDVSGLRVGECALGAR
jgi:hypothetical protein